MIIKIKYRLGEYLIAEDKHGMLLWETYFNFGVQRSGSCYIFGNILVLDNWSHEEYGYLQLEFSELLQKLPIWDKTQYYCFVSELLDVSTGQSITNDFLENYQALTRNTISKPIMNISPGIFRLMRYQITVADNADVSWQMHEGLDRVVSGRCVIESDLLLIGPQEYEEGKQGKQAFLDKLNKLPKWDNTMAWCRSLVLRPCKVKDQQVKNPVTTSIQLHIMDDYLCNEKSPPLNFDKPRFKQFKEPSKILLQLNFKWLETVWRRICEGKRWLKYLIFLFFLWVLFGLLMIWHSLEKKSPFHHYDKQHHHEHGD